MLKAKIWYSPTINSLFTNCQAIKQQTNGQNLLTPDLAIWLCHLPFSFSYRV